MPIGGLLAKAFDLKSRKPTRKCPRCGLDYPRDQESCPHCSDLSSAELTQFKARQEAERQGSTHLGRMFLLAAAFLLIGLLLLLARS